MQTIYTDGAANISLIDGVVRLDLITLSQVEAGKAQGRPVGALAMSVPGLVRLHQQLTATLDKMVEKGLVRKNSPQAQEPSVAVLNDEKASKTKGSEKSKK